ncbi:glycoside hydrolase family 29 protein [Panus rudis PR-1116 ss-1]|nr:glycoside hydrolase family 29 protein [Panus rudis PR-1116 ss-1]
MPLRVTYLTLVLGLSSQLVISTEPGNIVVPSAASTRLDLSRTFNIKAASTGPNDTFADFDGSGRAYPVEWLPKEQTFTYNGIEFTLPPFHDAKKLDAIRSDSQVVAIPSSNTTFHSFHALATSVWPASGSARARVGTLTYTFADGSTTTNEILVGPWWSTNPFDGPIHTPYHYANVTLDSEKTIDFNVTSIDYVTARIPNDKPLKSITLPDPGSFINIFSISLVPSSVHSTGSQKTNTRQPSLMVQNVRSTTKWIDSSDSDLAQNADAKIQQIEVTLSNLSPLSASQATSWLTTPYVLTFTSPTNGIETVIPGRVVRLRSNDQVVVRVGVRNKATVRAGTKVKVGVVLKEEKSGLEVALGTNGDAANGLFEIIAGIPAWVDSDESLRSHEAPDWYDDAKFGIFVHWGVYSVPAWAPTGQQYAEWYNWDFHNPPNSPTLEHHRETYGTSVVYDDFIANFTAFKWDPDGWTDLFADAGAKYFVLVTKHHEGFALFDTGNSSHRNSLLLGPKRDIVKDLFTSAKDRHPELHRGTYFSLPEWFNPSYAPYGRVSFPGGPARNAFNGSCCDPYTGYVDVEDYIQDLQKPQMSTLLFNYDTEILWCDIGGASAFPQLGASWYNYAASQNRQVVMNNRCGANQSDFVTPEYATFPAPLSQKWESSAGMDPFSYGYNSDTPPDAYQNASSILTELIDIVSKGGNFLIDIVNAPVPGPKADGTVIPEMTDPLRQVGQWLKVAGEAIYGTRPWFIQPVDDSSVEVRFTTKPDAFYIIAIEKPKNGKLTTSAPVPIVKNDKVTLLGGSGKELGWDIRSDGVLTVDVNEEELDRLPLPAWALKIAYADK